ncbi:alpha/beta fold hydrolase [Flavobacterium sp. N2270]|uniref:alpha/beta fold hydrolase n=1 Tax=Flavobacterium sp. N2270 TaxID=2986831 RepID=UPI0022242B65|nr:alpha/beta fold hydrolase [Flavobacterium sp. N2270]
MLEKIDIVDFTLENGKLQKKISLFYQVFGQPIGTAPVVVVNHALTGNSNVTGKKGWWNELIGENKTIDTNAYTVIAFNIPGNGFDGNDDNLIENYKDYSITDVAKFFWKGLFYLKVDTVYALIGGSLGGAIAWEMTKLEPNKVENLIPIATGWKASDWLIGNVLIQDLILNNSKNPIHDARIHAMLLYRTPDSLQSKFGNSLQSETDKTFFKVESWLLHHGEKLQSRFQLSSYKLMNHLLKTTDVLKENTLEEFAKKIQSNIHLVSVDTDYFFTANEIRTCFTNLKKHKQNVFYSQIQSIHGHDAFLIEFEQLNAILNPIFNK